MNITLEQRNDLENLLFKYDAGNIIVEKYRNTETKEIIYSYITGHTEEYTGKTRDEALLKTIRNFVFSCNIPIVEVEKILEQLDWKTWRD